MKHHHIRKLKADRKNKKSPGKKVIAGLRTEINNNLMDTIGTIAAGSLLGIFLFKTLKDATTKKEPPSPDIIDLNPNDYEEV